MPSALSVVKSPSLTSEQSPFCQKAQQPMNLVPHIDITDPARIQALLDDPRNFSWRAVDSETLDSFTPDLGLTGYAQPSVYRAGAVATSGISSTLRHRFWQTIENQADHTGTRYIGILIYLAAGEERADGAAAGEP